MEGIVMEFDYMTCAIRRYGMRVMKKSFYLGRSIFEIEFAPGKFLPSQLKII